MAKIDRFNGNLKAFGINAVGGERTVFGDVAQSDTLDANINTDFLRGWGIVGVNEFQSSPAPRCGRYLAALMINS